MLKMDNVLDCKWFLLLLDEMIWGIFWLFVNYLMVNFDNWLSKDKRINFIVKIFCKVEFVCIFLLD